MSEWVDGSKVKRIFGLMLIVVGLLHGCGGALLVSFPYDPNGRSLNSPFAEENPAMAGRYVVFTSDRNNRQDIYLYDTVARTLVETPGLNAIDMVETTPVISENGRYIAFAGSREGRSGVYLYDRETRQLRNLTENLRAEVRNPTISGDGSAIAFQSSVNGQWDILIYNRQGQPINGVTPP